MTPEELKLANMHLLSRLRPFLTNPSQNMSLTVFFYNQETSQSRTTRTNDSGHFNLRAALNFVPTHVRVLASENLSASEEVLITEPNGVSLISDIDDTIKHSAIGAGAREIFRNAFIRNLDDLTIEGVREWYRDMADRGVKMHYVSNSPWQMYPLLVSYFAKAGLPPGSFHLKQYSGMLQGIFEPVAERKRGTLDRILSDFPERRFILVGDSGEADLEVYTETALMNPGRILGIFIRDVTSTPKKGFFDPSNGNQATKPPFPARPDDVNGIRPMPQRPGLPARPLTTAAPPTSSAPSDIGDLIDFSDDFEPAKPSRANTEPSETSAEKPPLNRSSSSTRSVPPALPRKPIGLRGMSNEFGPQGTDQKEPTSAGSRKRRPRPPPKPRQLSNNGQQRDESQAQSSSSRGGAPPLPPDRTGYRASAMNRLSSVYNSLPSASDYLHGTPQPPSKPTVPSPRAHSKNPNAPPPPPSRKLKNASSLASIRSNASSASSKSNQDAGSNSNHPPPALPPRRGISSYPAAAAQYASNKWYGTEGQAGTNGEILSKREELWNRRWARSKEVLEKKGVVLRSWRVGGDVITEAERMVERENTQGQNRKQR
jgi:phosphatidate phosphatase APP1